MPTAKIVPGLGVSLFADNASALVLVRNGKPQATIGVAPDAEVYLDDVGVYRVNGSQPICVI